jgi:hypothetical protein
VACVGALGLSTMCISSAMAAPTTGEVACCEPMVRFILGGMGCMASPSAEVWRLL